MTPFLITPFGPYPARVDDVHDGDTIHLTIDLGFGITLNSHDFNGKPVLSCRAYGINAPELSNPDGSGKAALEFAQILLPIGTSVKLLSYGWDKYGGRYDGEIALPDGRDFSTVMIAAGHAVAKTY